MFRSTLAIFLLVFSVSAHSATIHVPGDWNTIQEAINASSNGDTIFVDPGTYAENIDFLGKAIIVKSTGGKELTTIDGNQSGSVVSFVRGEAQNSVIDGFTITNGNGNLHGSYRFGGGIYCRSSSPVIRNNLVTKNNSSGSGAGIHCLDGSSPTIESNIITGNETQSMHGDGGGVYCNKGSTPLIKNNTISSNRARYGGGIACAYIGDTPHIVGNIITDNRSEYGGGGIFCGETGPTVVIENNVIMNNTARTPDGLKGAGGGIHCMEPIAEIANNLIVENSAQGSIYGWGGGIVISEYSAVTLTGNTLSNNFASSEGGAIHTYYSSYVTVENCILWDNSAPVGKEISLNSNHAGSTLDIRFSDVDGGQAAVHVEPGGTLIWGAGMITADPLFVPGPDGVYYLSQFDAGQTLQSPCVDAGDPSTPSTVGTTRTDSMQDTAIRDMGYHFAIQSLFVNTHKIPAATGGTAHFFMNAGIAYAFRKYFLLGGMSGTSPGTSLPGGAAILPINRDFMTNYILRHPNTTLFQNFRGELSVKGLGAATLNLPPLPAYAGIDMNFAFAVFNPWDYSSNPVTIAITP